MFSAQEIYILRKEHAVIKHHNARLARSIIQYREKADKLDEENKKLRKENRKVLEKLKTLEEELQKIKKQRDTYKGMIFKPKVVVNKESQSGLKIKLGGQIGHPGHFRSLPKRVDQFLRVFLKVCPTCQTKLKRSHSFETHTVEDIPNFDEIKTQVTSYKMERQWCQVCHQEVVATPPQVIPFSRLGLNLIIQILIFKYVCRMSLEVMVTTLLSTYGVKISEAGLVDLLRRTKNYLSSDYGKLLKAIRSSPIKHSDETSWSIKGVNPWLWAFVTKDTCYYTIEQSRGGGIVRAVLDASKPTDVLIRDDYAGYKNLNLNQQSCWVHLLRKSKEEQSQDNCSKQMQNLHTNLKELYQSLEEEIQKPFNLQKRLKIYDYYMGELQQIMDTKFKALDAKRVQTRIRNQGNNLLTALLHDGVPLTNNAAERAIRPAVVIRKISGGSRSDEGAEAFATNFSLIQSIRMRNQPLMPTLKELLLNGIAGKN